MQAIRAVQSPSAEKENVNDMTANSSLWQDTAHEMATNTSPQKIGVEDKFNPSKKDCVEQRMQRLVDKPASADNLSFDEPQDLNQRRKKHVRFHESAKTWDGLRSKNALLQQLVVDFFADIPSVVLLRELLTQQRERDSFTVCSMLDDLISRVKQRAPEGAVLLPKGDSKCIKLHSSQLPRLERLRFLACAVHDKVVADIAVTKNDSQLACAAHDKIVADIAVATK